MRILILISIIFLFGKIGAQAPFSSHSPSVFFKNDVVFNNKVQDIITSPPNFSTRMMAEWEELQAIAITWDLEFAQTKKKVLADIAKYAKAEVEVLIICAGFSNDVIDRVKWELQSFGFENFDNLVFVESKFDKRVWIRDFGAHTLYKNDVEERFLLDWIYPNNNPFADESAPSIMSEFIETDIYATTSGSHAFFFDGGNILTDGLGMAISSTHIFNDNPFDEPTLDRIMQEFAGIDNYIKLEELPYNGIHHVDMYMKMLDEETILIGEFPDSIADGPQIEANIDYLLSNLKTSFGNDFEIHRIPMPADRNGDYPDEIGACSNLGTGCYYTYANALFINDLILVPIYFDGEGTDSLALNIWESLMPGFDIVGIDCSEIIKEYGAIHCITKEIGVAEPLRIVHEKVKFACENEILDFTSTIQHKDGIEGVKLFYSKNGSPSFDSINLEQTIDNQWITSFDAHVFDDEISYFLKATANNGKTIKRPIVGEKGPWKFRVDCKTSSTNNISNEILEIYPNPSGNSITVDAELQGEFQISIHDKLGRKVYFIENFQFPNKIDLSKLQTGIYYLTAKNEAQIFVNRIVKK